MEAAKEKNMGDNTHTPLLCYKGQANLSGWFLEQKGGRIIADHLLKEDAELIVKSVNNHDLLVEALKELVDLKKYKDHFGKDERYNKWQPKAWEKAREALSKAE